jgi:hypothetical protein
MVGASGIEPLTLATSKQCSTTELRACGPPYAFTLQAGAQEFWLLRCLRP